MTPIHEMLARIRWDPDFARARFTVGYWDRVAGEVLRIDLRDASRDADNPSFLDLIDAEGVVHEVPLHRVREIWRNGVLIWRRHPK